MTTSDVETIKELLTLQIAALEKRMCEKFVARDGAVQLQAREYERRLDILNGEAERLRQMQMTYLPREVAEKIEERREQDIKAIQRDVKDLQTYRDIRVGRNLELSAGVSAAIAIAVALISKFLT
jgi:tetrahydromethanopterin S-methyltransferase subunit F